MSMKVKSKLTLLVVVALMGMLFISGLGIYSVTDSDRTIQILSSQRMPKIVGVLQFSEMLSNLRRYSYVLLSTQTLDEKAAAQAILDDLGAYRAAIANTGTLLVEIKADGGFAPEVASCWADIFRKWPVLSGYLQQNVDMAERALSHPSPEAMTALYRHIEETNAARRPLFADIDQNVGQILKRNLELSAQTVTDAAARSKKLAYAQYAVTLIMLSLMTGIGYAMFRAVIKPLEEARNVVQKVAADHDFQLRVNVHSNDEVGEMLTDFNQMMGSLQETLHDIPRQVDEASEEPGSAEEKTPSQAPDDTSRQSSSLAHLIHEVAEQVNLLRTQNDTR
ncbi:hypothetical protein AGMMS49545_13370 [Betaproteobacteria bacterium]|nr:hypothetical protein AGMMS49545_13370 [Betaproteobacteria bacterium]GHU42490.1 hypothetical protein AGMMS50289_07300 [Betaproteobacteria bacterium]